MILQKTWRLGCINSALGYQDRRNLWCHRKKRKAQCFEFEVSSKIYIGHPILVIIEINDQSVESRDRATPTVSKTGAYGEAEEGSI